MMLPLLHAGNTATWWHWHLHPDVILFCVVLEVAYLYAVTQLRPMVSDAGRVRRTQVAQFSLGVFVIWLGAGTPLHDVSEQFLLSAHMLQHALFTLAAAPLLLCGIPAWLWQVPLRWKGVLPVARFIVHPVVALIIVNATLLLTHLPGTVDFALYHHAAHFWIHVLLIVTAVIMWWPVLSNVPELPRSSYPVQMAYLFVQSLLPTVLASFVTFADGAVYPFYRNAPRLWGLPALADQQIAGGIMKITGGLVIWWFIGLAFFRWYNGEQRREQEPRWEDVQEELERIGISGSR
jgi:putative membrane protein